MKHLKYFIPTRLGIIMGAGIGIATTNIAIGISITLMFSIAMHLKSTKN